MNYLSPSASQNFSRIAYEPSRLIHYIGYSIVQNIMLGLMFLVQKIYTWFNNNCYNNIIFNTTYVCSIIWYMQYNMVSSITWLQVANRLKVHLEALVLVGRKIIGILNKRNQGIYRRQGSRNIAVVMPQKQSDAIPLLLSWIWPPTFLIPLHSLVKINN